MESVRNTKNYIPCPMKITLVHQGALGDTLLLAPLLDSLKCRWPMARRTLVTRHSFGLLMVKLGVAEKAADVDDPVHSRWFAEAIDPAMPSPDWVDCQLLLSAVSDGRDGWAAHARRACRQAEILFFEPRPPPDYAGHVTAFHREQLARLNLPAAVMSPPVSSAGGPVLIHPGSGGREKCWPLANFVQVARELRQCGMESNFFLGEAELERFHPDQIARLEQEFSVQRNLPLAALADQLARVRAYLGNDSGVTHLAAQMGIPVMAIFGPSNVVQWQPMGPKVHIYRPTTGRFTDIAAAGEVKDLVARLRKICG